MDPLAQFDVLIPIFQKLAAGTTPDQLDQKTPCSDWQVRDLFDHLIGGATTFAAVIRGDEPPGDLTTPDQVKANTASTAAADLDAAFRMPGALEKTVATPFGDMPGDTFARLLAFDLLMHSWDLAAATGQHLDVPGDVLEAVDSFARAAVTDDLRGPQTFAPQVAVPDGTPPLQALVAFSGRTP